MKKLLVVLFVCSLIGAACKSKKDKAVAYYERANLEGRWNNFKAAIADYDTVIMLNPSYAQAYCKRGTITMNRVSAKDHGEKVLGYKAAIPDLDKAIALNPACAEAYYQRGIAQDYLNDKTGALADYNKAIALGLKNWYIYSCRGDLRFDKDVPGAIADYDTAIKLDAGNAALYFIRAKMKRAIGNYSGALDDYNKGYSLLPSADLYLCRAEVKTEMKNYAGAIAEYDTAIAAYRSSGEDMTFSAKYYQSRGLVKNLDKDYRRAIADFDTALYLNGRDDEFYLIRAVAKYNMGNYNGAIKDCSIAIDKQMDESDDSDAYLYRGLAKMKLGQKKSACSDLNDALRLGDTKAATEIGKYCR